jgi:hypothetical protein
VRRGVRHGEHCHDRQHGDINAGPDNANPRADRTAGASSDGRSDARGDLDPDAASNAAAIASTITNAGCNDPARTRAPMRPYRRLRSD